MSIKVKAFASLSEKLGFRETDCPYRAGMKVRDVWYAVSQGKDMPQNMFVSVNLEYGTLDGEIHDGDEVGFFPPVTGG